MGKYGEEGDKLLFKILNSGDYLKDAPDDLLAAHDSLHLTTKISEKGLRYDLTVPFARYVVQHQNEISFPFKRFQIQPVWRADRPQRGRYREFYQCDADVVGSDSLVNEVELVSMIDEVFKRFGINIVIKLNNRKILSGIAEVIGAPDKIVEWSQHIPFITNSFGNHISLFCLLMTVTNIIYTYITTKSQAQSQSMPGMKAMMYLMPLMFLVFFNNYASGLSYYYFISLLITILQTYSCRLFITEDKVRATMAANAVKPKKKSKWMARLEEAQKMQQQQQQRQRSGAQQRRKR
jgi:hypothetical protein